jgi:transposase InsO family protein
MVVSWSIGTRPNAELVDTMLDAAVEKITAGGDRPVVHSDRGGHYRWPGWLSRIAEAKLERSMSRKGYSPDNPSSTPPNPIFSSQGARSSFLTGTWGVQILG